MRLWACLCLFVLFTASYTDVKYKHHQDHIGCLRVLWPRGVLASSGVPVNVIVVRLDGVGLFRLFPKGQVFISRHPKSRDVIHKHHQDHTYPASGIPEALLIAQPLRAISDI